MTSCDLAVLTRHEKRLRFVDRDFARGRIAHVTDGARAAQAIECRLIERFRDVSHLSFEPQLDAVGSYDAAGFLAAVLQRIKAEIGQSRGVRVAVDAEDTTLFTELVDLDFGQGSLSL